MKKLILLSGMSTTRYIKTRVATDPQQLENDFTSAIPDLRVRQKADNLSYLWLDKKSSRGVDLTFETPYWIEIRNTSNSNLADYELTNSLAEALCLLYDGQPYLDNEDYDEDDPNSAEYISGALPLFSNDEIKSAYLRDAEIIKILVEHDGSIITLFGPNSSIDIGPYVMSGLDTPLAIATKIEELFRDLNYKYNRLPFVDARPIGAAEIKKHITYLPYLGENIVVVKDYAIIMDSAKRVAISRDAFNRILPASWKRLDETKFYTTQLSIEDRRILVSQARRFDKWEQILSDGELMRYFVYVCCNCYPQGKTVPPPYEFFVKLGAEGWMLDIPKPDPGDALAVEAYNDAIYEFEEWRETACRHPDMIFRQGVLANHKRFESFKSVLGEIDPDNYPTLINHLILDYDQPLQPDVTLKALQELQRLKSRKHPYTRTVLRDKHSKKIVDYTYPGITSEIKRFDENMFMVLSDNHFYILEEKETHGSIQKWVVFKADHFIMIITDKDESVGYIDPNAKSFKIGVRFPVQLEEKPDDTETEYEVIPEDIEVISHFQDLIDGLEGILTASVEMQHPVHSYYYYAPII